MSDTAHHLIANLTGGDIFVVVSDDPNVSGRVILTFLLRHPGRTDGIVHRIAPRHYAGIAYDAGRGLRYRIENQCGAILTPGTMPDGRPCWAVTGFRN